MQSNVVVKQVAVGILVRNQKILIAQRPTDKDYAGYWEFPGGKVEPNETVLQALSRELKEELDIHIVQEHAELFLVLSHDYDQFSVLLNVYLVKNFSGTAKGLEGQQFGWISIHELDQFQFLETNRLIIEKLKAGI